MESNQDKKSHNLEVVSGQSLFNDSFVEKRSLPRLVLTSEQFRVSKTQRIYSVCDLSENGMGLWFSEPTDIEFFFVGLLVEGHLNLHRQKYFLKARVKNVNRDRVGFEFEELSEEVQKALHRSLSPEGLGQDLKPLPSSERNTLWYHGPSGTDLLLQRFPDGQYSKLNLYVLGIYVQWNQDEGLVTGKTSASNAFSDLRGVVRHETLLLHPDPTPDLQKLEIAKKIVMSSNLSQDLKNWCIRQLGG